MYSHSIHAKPLSARLLFYAILVGSALPKPCFRLTCVRIDVQPVGAKVAIGDKYGPLFHQP